MYQMRKAAIAAIAVLSAAATPGWSDVTLKEVRERNAASQAAVANLQAHAEIAIQYNPSQLPSEAKDHPLGAKYILDYVRSGNIERRRELAGSALGVRDIIQDFGNNTGSTFEPEQISSGARILDTGMIYSSARLPVLAPIWELVLFDLSWYRQPLSRLLEEGEVKTLKTTTEKGRTLVYLDVYDSKKRRFELWIDPSVNYLICKLVAHWRMNGRNAGLEGEVLSFREVKPGVYFPERAFESSLNEGKWMDKIEAAFTNIRVNESLPADLFVRTFPPGTRVTDQQRGQFYIVGGNGQPTEMARFGPSTQRTAIVGTQTPLTTEEGWPWHRFVLIGSVIAVMSALGGILWKRRRLLSA